MASLLTPRYIGRTKGGLNFRLHAVCDGEGRPLVMLPSEGQMSDCKGAALMVDALPKAETPLADKGYDADWLRQALTDRRIAPCIPSKTNRKTPIAPEPGSLLHAETQVWHDSCVDVDAAEPGSDGPDREEDEAVSVGSDG